MPNVSRKTPCIVCGHRRIRGACYPIGSEKRQGSWWTVHSNICTACCASGWSFDKFGHLMLKGQDVTAEIRTLYSSVDDHMNALEKSPDYQSALQWHRGQS